MKEQTLPLISIVVPVYNIQQYLPLCLDSIINQTYTNLEIIVVDDGSTDGSGEICDQYGQKDNRIQILHCTNGGLSVARNRGLKAAKGTYIGFVDGDDWIEPTFYESLYNVIKNNNVDLAFCSFYIDKNGECTAKYQSGKVFCWNKEESLKKLLKDKQLNNYAWNKLYKRTLFDSISFPPNKYYEDILTLYKVFLKVEKTAYIEKPLYHYIHRDGSILHTEEFQQKREYQLFEALYTRNQFFYSYDRTLLSISLNKTLRKGKRVIHSALLDKETMNHSLIKSCIKHLSEMDIRNAKWYLRAEINLITRHFPVYVVLYKYFNYLFNHQKRH